MSLDIGGIVLNKILANPSESIEAWAKLKLSYFNSEYSSIFSTVNKFYYKHSYVPSFDELIISTRDGLLTSKLKALQKLEVPEDISLDLAVEALINEFTQTEALSKLDKFIDNVILLDTEEIKQELADILLYLEEKTHNSEKVVLMSDVSIMQEEDIDKILMPLGINNTFDSEIRAYSSDLIMLGGKVGTGKSVLSTNLSVQQYRQGNIGLYFSIEMPAQAVFNRHMSILSGVDYSRIRNGGLTDKDKLALVKTRADFFIDSEDLVEQYINDRDFYKFETQLTGSRKLKQDNQIIIIDNQRLSLADIDMTIQKFKAQFGDRLKTAVVDYVNQIVIEDIYNWKQQISLSKGLKDLARKYEVTMVTPYQINAEGQARFSKGILDAADLAMNLEAGDEYIKLTSTKTRDTPPFEIASEMQWNCLRMLPTEYIFLEEDGDTEEESPKKKEFERTDEDIPF